jgi:creatinine amidohydrolase/Fe(II)-dependent formamide hydrolase-like protein
VRIADMNWMQVDEYLRRDDRAVLPLGSTEQHCHLRLTVDCILPERVAVDAAEPLGVPVFPVVPYGVSPYFRDSRARFRCASKRTCVSSATSSTAWRTAAFAAS